MEAATRCTDLSLLPPLLAESAGPPLPSGRRTHLPPLLVEPQVPERCSTPPPGPRVENNHRPLPRPFLPWIPAATSVSRLPGGGRGESGVSGVWRCCQPRGERLDKYSPREGGRRQGLSTSTAFGVSPQLGRVTFSVLLCVCVLITGAATLPQSDSELSFLEN